MASNSCCSPDSNNNNNNQGNSNSNISGSSQKRPPRKNGFQYPFHLFQVATWLLFPLILLQYYAFLMPLLWSSHGVSVLLTLLYTCFSVGTMVAVYFTVGTDPIDESYGSNEVQHQHRIGQSDSSNSTSNSNIHCYLCERDVHSSSKHCRECDKCVMRFDHHCKWLNTCIGAKNYSYFLCILVSVTLLTMESLAISIALLVEAFISSDRLMHHHHHRIDMLSMDVIKGLLIASILVLFALVTMLLQLGSFHIVLLYRGLTTYDFIVLEQKRLREKEQERIRLKLLKKQNKEEEGQATPEEDARAEGRGMEMQVTPSSGSEQRVVGRDYSAIEDV